MVSDALARALAASAGALGLRGGETELGRGLPRLLRECLELYREHPHWPSRLTSTGLPLEFSIAIDGRGRPTLRLLFDLADHRFWLEGNYGRYFSAAAELTGAAPERLYRLFSEHLDGGVPTTRSPVYHGVRWGQGDSRHTTLYLFIGGLGRAEVERRFAGPLATIDAGLAVAGGRRPERYHVVAYDFDEAAALRRTKLYGWLEVDGSRVRDVLGEEPCVAAAEEIAAHLGVEARDGQRDRALLLQSSVSGTPAKCGHKVIFNGNAWGFDSSEMLSEVGLHLSRRFGVDLSALRTLISAFEAHGICLLPSWLGLGHDRPAPACTFYFVPVPEHQEAAYRGGGLSARMTQAIRRAVEYLFGQRSPDGSWSDGPHGDADVVTTARVAAALTAVPEALDRLRNTGHWLTRRMLEDVALRADPEAGPLSVLVLQRLGLSAPAGTVRVLLDSAGPPERVALVLQARLAARRCTAAQGDALLQELLERERWSGGWSGASDDLPRHLARRRGARRRDAGSKLARSCRRGGDGTASRLVLLGARHRRRAIVNGDLAQRLAALRS